MFRLSREIQFSLRRERERRKIMEYKIRHFSTVEYWEGGDPIYINMVFEPLEDSFKKWCELESDDYQLLTIIKDDYLLDYKKEMGNIIIGESNTLDFSKLDKYNVRGYNYQNNILEKLKTPFDYIYRYCEVFEINNIVLACLEKLKYLYKNPTECNNQSEFISILKTLDNWWY